MDTGSIVDLIQNVGFPVAACIYLAWRAQLESKQHKEEVDKLSSVIESNTLAIQHLTDSMDYPHNTD